MHDSERAGKGEIKRKEKGKFFNQHTTNPHTTQTQLGNPTNIQINMQINGIHIMTIPWQYRSMVSASDQTFFKNVYYFTQKLPQT